MVATMALCFLGTGCGSSDTGSGTSAAIPKAQFVKSAEQVCVDGKKERRKAGKAVNYKEFESTGGKFDEDEFVAAVEKTFDEEIAPSLQKQHDELEALGSPEADEAKVERMLQSLAKGIEFLEKEGIAALGGNQFDPFEKEASEYGLTCKVF